MLRVIFENPSRKKKAQQQGQQRISKQMAKPSGPSDRNNGSQAHKINRWALTRQVGLKKPEKREIAYPWADKVRKVRKGHHKPKVMQTKKVRG